MGDMYQELEITKKADTLRTVYDNNLFFYSVDSLKGLVRYYPSDGVGKPATHDIMDVQASALFASYSPYFTNDWFALDGQNDYHLLPTAAALGHGFTPPGTWANPYFPGNLPGDVNIGATKAFTLTSVAAAIGSPHTFVLQQNYPNPFNPSTNVEFSLPSSSQVRLTVYNMLGQEVATLVNGQMEAGTHTVRFDASRLSSGIYLYRLNAGSFVKTMKMILLK